jgi:hypothetical protein
MHIRPVNSVISSPLVFMDDTGATDPTTHPDDLLWDLPNVYHTANGLIQLPTTWLEAAFLDIFNANHLPVTNYIFFFCLSK